MPSFDVVSKVDGHEITNAVDQANREIGTRFDFKGVDAKYLWADEKITMKAPTKFHIEQMKDILVNKLAKRKVDIKSLDYKEMEISGHEARQIVEVRQGIDTDNAKKIVKFIKEKKLKVQAAIQGDQVRVTGKQRDDLQDTIAMLKEADIDLPLQYENFRD